MAPDMLVFQQKIVGTYMYFPYFSMKTYIVAGMWNYQILLLVHRQVNGQNPLAQPRFTCPKIESFSYFLKKTYFVGTH